MNKHRHDFEDHFRTALFKAAGLIPYDKDALARKQQLRAAFGGPEEPDTRPVDQTTDTNSFELPTRTVEH
jgi:hypothetical protein